MRLELFTVLAGVLLSSPVSLAQDLYPQSYKKEASIETYIQSEGAFALKGIWNNIGSKGSKDEGAKDGVIVAAPSTNPDYRYTWIRDSSLVLKCLVDRLTSGRGAGVKELALEWIPSQGRLQQITNPSGSLTTGGLGEPKFELNETEYTGDWGRPQRDGPALRTTAINAFVATQPTSFLQKNAWPVLQLDLDYIADFWNQTGFDLWEELNGSSFFTSSAQHRALREGAKLAASLGDKTRATTYTQQADNVLCFLQTYWNPQGNYIVSNINLPTTRSGLDANSILSSIHNFDPNAGCDSNTFQPCSDKALANHKAVVDSFRSIYTINKNTPTNQAVAVGRYSDDVYFDGNPWYLTTFAAAEQLYDAVYQWQKQHSVEITAISLPFFKQIYPAARVGVYPSSSSTFRQILKAVSTYADGFIAINQKYTPKDGALSEQFSRENGTQLSAPDLTWSYASALTAFDAREGRVPPSWGAKYLVPPKVCKSRPVKMIDVTFNLASDSENASLVGSLTQLKSWDPAQGIPLKSTGTDGHFSVTVSIPASITFEYKYIRKSATGEVTWESGPNNRVSTPGEGPFSIDDTWR
jgi:glucoamylase